MMDERTKPITPAYRVETERLVVRCYTPNDAGLLKEAVDSSLEHLRPWMPWAAYEPETLEKKVALMRTFRGQFDLNQDYVYGIFNRDETQLVGGTGLHTRLGPGVLEIGYWIRSDGINQGYATESSAALTRIAFEVMGVRRVEIHCNAANARSAAVPRKLGYTHEATLRKRIQEADGQYYDTMIWSLLEEDYDPSPSASARIHAYDAAGGAIALGMEPLSTRRLDLRPVRWEDLGTFERLWSDPDVMRFLPTGLPRSNEAALVQHKYMLAHGRKHGFGVWAICLEGTSEMIGYCGLMYLHAEPGGVSEEAAQTAHDVELLYGLDRAYWGQGIAGEAAQAVLAYGFDRLQLPRVVAAIHPDNIASRRILERLGLREDKGLAFYGECPHFSIIREEPGV